MKGFDKYGQIAGHSKSSVIRMAIEYAKDGGFLDAELRSVSTHYDTITVKLYSRSRHIFIYVYFYKKDLSLKGVQTGDCHITTVVCYGIGLPDDCYELNQLRRFRDEYLNKEGYSKEVEDYYLNSIFYARQIEKRAKSDPGLYKMLFHKYINPAVKQIEQNNMKEAHFILRKYLIYIKESFIE